MFEKNTVLILGAGASCDFDYPTGAELITNINSTIIKDKICSNFIHISFNEMLKRKNQSGPHIFKGQNTMLLHSNEELKLLSDDLHRQRPINIDSFLKDNLRYQKIGKQMVAYQILKHEKLKPYDRSLFPINNWHTFLIDAIRSKCHTPQDIFNNKKLTIITFNYDVSLEYDLYHMLTNRDFFITDGIDHIKNFCEEFCEKNIIHIYGSVRNSPVSQIYLDYGEMTPLFDANEVIDNNYLPTIRWILAEKAAQGIFVIGEKNNKNYSLKVIYKKHVNHYKMLTK